MICLIRNLTNIQVTDQLPGPDDDSEGAALSRLEYYRKQIAYSQECDLSVTEFGKYWADITKVRSLFYTLKTNMTCLILVSILVSIILLFL